MKLFLFSTIACVVSIVHAGILPNIESPTHKVSDYVYPIPKKTTTGTDISLVQAKSRENVVKSRIKRVCNVMILLKPEILTDLLSQLIQISGLVNSKESLINKLEVIGEQWEESTTGRRSPNSHKKHMLYMKGVRNQMEIDLFNVRLSLNTASSKLKTSMLEYLGPKGSRSYDHVMQNRVEVLECINKAFKAKPFIKLSQ
ncbi:hypothetical protein O5D80_003907 [Batrachochytrium dendrobatidis]|nr:hypothetical protein O5D80_003907 [Batrachochytrium dendrobatidis]